MSSVRLFLECPSCAAGTRFLVLGNHLETNGNGVGFLEERTGRPPQLPERQGLWPGKDTGQ